MDGKSKNLTEQYIEQLKALFPEVVTEVADKEGDNISHKVDMEKLALLLGEAALPTDEVDYRAKYCEKFSFEWAGKRRAIAEAQKRSTGTLRPCPEDSVDWDSTENLYIEGDNLEVLKLMQDSYLGAVKMIYIDPPYNTGKDFVYKDNYKDNLTNYLEMTNTTNAVNTEASGRYHTNWLNMLYPRLKLARNLLSDDGVIFISIDDNEVSNLKTICDEIFGEDNFIANIIWQKKTGASDAINIATITEYILLYGKGVLQTKINQNFNAHDKDRYKYEDKYFKERGRFYYDSLDRGTLGYIKSLDYPILAPDGTEVFPNGRNEILNDGWRWKWGKDKLKWGIDNGFIEVRENNTKDNGWGVYYKIYENVDNDGNSVKRSSPYKNLIQNVLNTNASSETKGIFNRTDYFSNPKPSLLIKHLLSLGSKSDDVILDFFSGSATTAHAVMQLNAEDGGNRKYICVQLPESTPEDSEARKAGYATIPEIAKERIRRAGKKIVDEQKAKTEKEGNLFSQNEEAQKLDIGFKVFKLDRSNVKEWDVEFDGLNEKQAAENLAFEFSKTMEILKDGRTEQDLLYEVILKFGLPLSTKVETKEVDGKTVFVVGHGVMIASFAKGLTSAQIGKMLDLKADFVQASEFKVVLADESFATDNDKTNAMQLFKQRGITNYEII